MCITVLTHGTVLIRPDVDGEQKIAFVVDRNLPGHRSVTNDAENVVADIAAMGTDVDRYRLVYQDSCGTWDGLDTRGGKFIGFYAIGARDWLEAAFMALTRRTPAQLVEVPPR
jgi:hypothetical protein